MAAPPPEDDPPSDTPPPAGGLPPDDGFRPRPPPDHPPAAGEPQFDEEPAPGPPPGAPPYGSGGVGTPAAGACLGVLLWLPVNLTVGFVVVFSSLIVLAPLAGAILLALIAFGGGGALAARGSSTGQHRLKGMGWGLMIGWALTSILTAGYCTGLNPDMYL